MIEIPSPLPVDDGVAKLLEAPGVCRETLRESLLDGTYGRPFVLEHHGVRSLYFSLRFIQSSMRLTDPDALDLPYTRRMMAFLLFNARPRSVLMLGLGGGSLAKFCYRHLPQAEITAVEIDPDVIAFRDEFRIPPDDERFAVVHADGAEYLNQGAVRADVILADAFDTEGIAPGLADPEFAGNLHRCLSRDGILAINIAGGRSSYAGLLDRIQVVFGGRLLAMSGRDDGNVVVLAFKNKDFAPNWKRAKTAARQLQTRFGLEFTQFVQQLECGERRGLRR